MFDCIYFAFLGFYALFVCCSLFCGPDCGCAVLNCECLLFSLGLPCFKWFGVVLYLVWNYVFCLIWLCCDLLWFVICCLSCGYCWCVLCWVLIDWFWGLGWVWLLLIYFDGCVLLRILLFGFCLILLIVVSLLWLCCCLQLI